MNSSSLSAGIARLETCSPGACSTTQGCWPLGSEPGAWQPLYGFLFLVIWSQKRDKRVRSVKLSIAHLAVNAWGQWCTCWADPWATSRDFCMLKGWKLSNKQASSSQKEREQCRAFFCPVDGDTSPGEMAGQDGLRSTGTQVAPGNVGTTERKTHQTS